MSFIPCVRFTVTDDAAKVYDAHGMHRASRGAAGVDIRAVERDVVDPQGGRALIRTGLILAIPEGYEGQIRPRSGLALAHGVTVLNAPGTIDSDYRGEISVLLVNHGDVPFVVNPGDRIAQLVVAVVPLVEFEFIDGPLPDTERGSGGFGSTGME